MFVRPAYCLPSVSSSCVAKVLTLNITHNVFKPVLSYLTYLHALLTSIVLNHFSCFRVTQFAENKTCLVHFVALLTNDRKEILNEAIQLENYNAVLE